MNIQKYLLILAALFTLIGSFYLVLGNFKSATDIVRESGSYFGGNYPLRVNFITARIYSIVGFALLGAGIMFQILAAYFVVDKEISAGYVIGSILVIAGVVILISSLYIDIERRRLIQRTSKIEIMKYEMPERSSIKDRIEQKYAGRFMEIGKNFFLIEKTESESINDYIDRLCREIERIK